MKKYLLCTFVIALMVGAHSASAQTISPLRLTITSAKTLNGIAGDHVVVTGEITNTSTSTLNDITTYLSLVDMGLKLPVDLEDWSAEKGLFIGSIDPGRTFPLNWKIHFVKAGEYSLAVIADVAVNDTPIPSIITHFSVAPKHNLNPGNVMPVALGMPIFLLLAMALLQYRRGKKVGSG